MITGVAVLARVIWVIAVPQGGDSLDYWQWATALGDGNWSFHYGPPYWTATYPIWLWVLSLGQTLTLQQTAIMQAAIQGTLVIPVIRLLTLLELPAAAITAGALAIAVAPYTSFSGSRLLADPLTTLLWWGAVAEILSLSARTPRSRRWWIRVTAAAIALGVAAYLRLNFMPMIAVTCVVMVAAAWRSLGTGVARTAMAIILLVPLGPAVVTTITKGPAIASHVDDDGRFRRWIATFYVSYDRDNVLNHNFPWRTDPRPWLPEGWRDRDDGPAVNALIESSLAGAPKEHVEPALATIAEDWRANHPLRMHVGLPALRIAAAWIPLSPELWVRATPYRVAQYIERCLTLFGLITIAAWAVRSRRPAQRRIAASVGLLAFAQPTLAILSTHVAGMQFSDYRSHHAGWVVPLALGSACLARAVVAPARPEVRRPDDISAADERAAP